MTDPVALALIGMIGSVALGIVNLVGTLLTRRDVSSAKKAIVTLERNTNSIKDALVKVTGESEFAKGLKQGEDNPRA